MATERLAPNAPTDERMAVAIARIDELGDWIARLANEDRMQIGRIPERLTRASVMLEDARDLVQAARNEWIEAD